MLNNSIAESMSPKSQLQILLCQYINKLEELIKYIYYNKDFNLGLEYMIEIQHNTMKKMPNNYCCLLCMEDIKVKKDSVDTVLLAKKHLLTYQHKLKYVVIQYRRM